MNKINLLTFSCALLLCSSLFSCSCSSPSSKRQKSKEVKDSIQTTENLEAPSQINKPDVKIYLENSGSMFGYLGAGGDFKNVVTRVAGDCDLEASAVSYSLINGKETKLGSDLKGFTDILSVSGLQKGDPSTSDLNGIFDKALKNANRGNVSILISDGIYSVNGSPQQLLGDLQSQSVLTRNKFVRRLREENLITQLIKFKSEFSGYYYPAAGGQIMINQKRPYYIWLIGDKNDIKNLFADNYFEELPGFEDVVKYIKLEGKKPVCGLLRHNAKGSYTYKRGLELKDVEPRNLETAFSIGFDFKDIPLPSSYFDQLEVYQNELGYEVTSVKRFEDLSPSEIASAQTCIKSHCTHVVTFEKQRAPWGTMILQVKNLKPVWIDQTHDNDDSDIAGDENKTFGFKYLVKGLNDAYTNVNQTENLAEYIIKINQ
jgi:hypothetical protein